MGCLICQTQLALCISSEHGDLRYGLSQIRSILGFGVAGQLCTRLADEALVPKGVSKTMSHWLLSSKRFDTLKALCA